MKILDCTLRDGGYYTNWDFSSDLVKLYFDAFNQLPVDYLEVGYRSNPMKEYLGEYYYCPEYLLKKMKSQTNKKLVVILNEKDVRAEHTQALLGPCIGVIDMVRIALDPAQLPRALKLAEAIKKLGFEVGFNIMYMSKWKQDTAFLEEIRHVDGIADYFYMVDSYGGVYPEDVKEIIALVKARTNVKLGFHGHNNLELGLINTLTAIEHGAEMVDATVTGMGRGAGNLKTELLLTALNTRNNLEVDFTALSAVVDGFEKLQLEYGWGTNLPYMVSGSNSLPQKDVMEWVTSRIYSFNSIIRALNNQKNKLEDNTKLPVFEPVQKFDNVLIIGGGPNAVKHGQAIREYIQRQKNLCIIHASSKNAGFYKDIDVPQFFCLVGNEGHRLEKVFRDFGDFRGICVLPPYPRKMGTYIPPSLHDNSFELKQINFTDSYKDSHTAITLQTAIDLGASRIALVGYDGYQEKVIDQQERMLSSENEFLFRKIMEFFPGGIFMLTPTNYSTLPVHSVYSDII